MSIVTEILSVEVFPNISVATAVIKRVPSPKMRSAVKVPPPTEALTPLTVTVACGSSTVPVTVTAEVLEVERFKGAVIATCGGMVSMVTVMAAWLVLSAGSVAVAVMVFCPSASCISAVKVLLVTCAFIPFTVTAAVSSSIVPVIVIGVALLALPSAGEVMAIIGSVLSMFTVVLVNALLSALSTAEPEMFWLAPSDVIVTGEETLAIPERLSEAEKATVTSVLFQPA